MSIVILKYQDNFADNLSELAYGRIIEDKTQRQCFFENDSQKRQKFEFKMSNFNMDFRYISKNQVQSIAEQSYLFSRKLITSSKIKNELLKRKSKDKIVDISRFKIDDIGLITNEIKDNFSFKNLDFLVNYDILDEITSSNSIGLYINKNDADEINPDYIYSAVKRLNKYLKKPKLYIFSNGNIDLDIDIFPMNSQNLHIIDWREEFYLLTQCKNKIILSNNSSYSACFWASVLNKKNYLVTFEESLKVKKIPENWLAI